MIGLGDSLTFEEALQRVVDEDAALTSADLYALSAPSLAGSRLFRSQWPAVSDGRRREIVALLVENAEANFELDFNALFRLMLEDDHAEVRTLSIKGLWEDDEPTLIAPLVRILQYDAAPAARAEAASLLGRFLLKAELEEMAPRCAVPVRAALLEVIDDCDEHVIVQCRAVESIAYLSEGFVQDIIAAAYESTDESMRISAVFAMGRSMDATWAEHVLTELSNRNPAMRCEAARACGELEIKEAISPLIRFVSDPDPEVQAAAVEALGQIGGQRARGVLERCCGSEDDALRAAAEDALGELLLGQQPLDLFVYSPEAGEDDEATAGATNGG